MQGLKITSEGFRQLVAAFQNPTQAAFTAEAFENIPAGAESNFGVAFGLKSAHDGKIMPGSYGASQEEMIMFANTAQLLPHTANLSCSPNVLSRVCFGKMPLRLFLTAFSNRTMPTTVSPRCQNRKPMLLSHNTCRRRTGRQQPTLPTLHRKARREQLQWPRARTGVGRL